MFQFGVTFVYSLPRSFFFGSYLSLLRILVRFGVATGLIIEIIAFLTGAFFNDFALSPLPTRRF